MGRTSARDLDLILAILPCLLSGACLFIPTAFTPNQGSRGKILKGTTHLLRVGSTTREEVLLRLGEPDLAAEGDMKFAYVWQRTHGVFVIAGGPGAAGVPVIATHLLLIQFDQKGIVRRVERQVRKSGSLMEALKGWPEPVNPSEESR